MTAGGAAPWPIQWFEELGSTNTHALDFDEDRLASPLWIAAERQTAARGRLQRKWTALNGNLFASAVWIESQGMEIAARVPFAAALAVRDAVAAFLPEELVGKLKLKWPNDVLLDSAKLAGILVETQGGVDRLRVVCGVGLNLAGAPEGAASLAPHLPGGPPAPEAAAERLSEAFAGRLQQARQDFGVTLADWQRFGPQPGAALQISATGQTGRYAGLAEDGALLLDPDGCDASSSGPIVVRAGDVSLIGEAV